MGPTVTRPPSCAKPQLPTMYPKNFVNLANSIFAVVFFDNVMRRVWCRMPWFRLTIVCTHLVNIFICIAAPPPFSWPLLAWVIEAPSYCSTGRVVLNLTIECTFLQSFLPSRASLLSLAMWGTAFLVELLSPGQPISLTPLRGSCCV